MIRAWLAGVVQCLGFLFGIGGTSERIRLVGWCLCLAPVVLLVLYGTWDVLREPGRHAASLDNERHSARLAGGRAED